MCIEIGIGKVEVYIGQCGFVMIGVVRGVGVVADGGREGCFVVVGDDWVCDLWWLGEFVRREEWAA
jgi:hypothetical protein